MTESRRLTSTLTFLMAVGVGVMVANLYYLQPVLHQVRDQFHVGSASASLLVVLTQAGYALGLAFLVPLGDLFVRRRLITTMFIIAAATMGLAGLTTNFAAFTAICLLVGLTSVGTQLIIPFAADLAESATRGRSIARVMSGLLSGILLSRTASGIVAQFFGCRATGDAISFVTPDDQAELRSLERFIGRGIVRKRAEGFDYNAPAPAFDPKIDARGPRPQGRQGQRGGGGGGGGRSRGGPPTPRGGSWSPRR